MKKRMGNEYGRKLVTELKTGVFQKDYRTNHGPDFAEGLEELHRYRFRVYLGSCGRFLMDERIAADRSEYYG
ncbi:hypothetical protein C806_03324 [Lachnospiraceae bacterium 3-1]|nr:hypothetical protein C806_03324 [Lachnospiraceae bacterium 3-1]